MDTESNAKESTQGKQKDIEIGALWTRVSKNGQKYLSGKIEIDAISAITSRQIKVVAFPNSGKTHDKQPDLRLYISKIDAQQDTQMQTLEPQASSSNDPVQHQGAAHTDDEGVNF